MTYTIYSPSPPIKTMVPPTTAADILSLGEKPAESVTNVHCTPRSSLLHTSLLSSPLTAHNKTFILMNIDWSSIHK